MPTETCQDSWQKVYLLNGVGYSPSAVEEVGHPAINVLLSQDETYADITPVRVASNGVSAFV